MRKFVSAILILVIGGLMIYASGALRQNPKIVQNLQDSFIEDCESLSAYCLLVAPVAKDVDILMHELNRQKISKDELPVVRLYMNEGAIRKLAQKRKHVLNLPKAIHISEKKDWVKGNAIVEYANKTEQAPVTLRLKGDWEDHLKHPKKISLRIKTRSNKYLFGKKTFSIQNPVTRFFDRGPMILDHMRAHGVLAPRQQFVDFYVNDNRIGIMNLEEHFSKELLESNNRRDGPILAFNEDPMWAQWNINFNIAKIETPLRTNTLGYRDAEIKNFNDSPFIRGSLATHSQAQSIATLRDFYDGKLPTSDVFDYKKTSKYWILTNVWGGCHSMVWHNRRFYFNTISNLFEPISFDNNAYPGGFRYCADAEIQAALQDIAFHDYVDRAAEEILAELRSAEFAQSLKAQQDQYQAFFGLDGFADIIPRVTPNMLIDNFHQFFAIYERIRNDHTAETGNVELVPMNGTKGNISNSRVMLEPGVYNELFLEAQSQLHTHLSAFFYPNEDIGKIEFRNRSLKDIRIEKVWIKDIGRQAQIVDLTPFTLVNEKKQTETTVKDVGIPDESLFEKNAIQLEYIYEGQNYVRSVPVQFKNRITGFADSPLLHMREVVGDSGIVAEEKKIVFSKGNYRIEKNIALPPGWRVVLEPDSRLSFLAGAILKVSGPLFVRGTAQNPVTLEVHSNDKFMAMGAWGGIFVSQSATRSKINHLQVFGTKNQNLRNRQGYFGLTGCVSFFESDVDIANSKFVDAQCEDALNIVKSDFTMSNVLIEGSRADAFDSDFSTGHIQDSKFATSGNDGIDVSGTRLHLSQVTMREIGDKAISVGENSHLTADNIVIDGAVLGVVSKDLSTVDIENAHFNRVSGTALMTYIKKPEFGPSDLICQRCEFEQVKLKTGRQAGTSITLNGNSVTGDRMTAQQVSDAGLTESVIMQ